jgi:hypothetical protein
VNAARSRRTLRLGRAASIGVEVAAPFERIELRE